ncbi:MAG: lipopolysaccharide kinase InaA family protein [Gemmatimonadaceae bacterium]
MVSMPGYAKVSARRARGLVVEPCLEAVQAILEKGTLYDYARQQPGARSFTGRAPAYATDLGDGCGSVVVRHSMRGGLLGRTGSDLFLPPTRGLRELVNSLQLRLSGVATPEVVAIVSYRAGPLLRRGDVATREISDSHDLSVVLGKIPRGEDRDGCLRAAGRLLSSLTRAGAHHPDLNARNILITWDDGNGARAHVLDVDRIRFHVPGDPMVAGANFERLERSLRKLRGLGAFELADPEIDAIRRSSLEARLED